MVRANYNGREHGLRRTRTNQLNSASAMTPAHYLRPLLAPRSIALVGASERAGSLGRIVYENLLGGGFQGDAFAVNPRHATVLGRRSYASLSALGRSIDLAVICAPPREVPAIITEARGRASAAVIMSGAPAASVAEYQQWRRQLADARENAGIRVLGPASFGVIRTSLGLNATYGQTIALPGRLALISQSGAMVGALLDFARLAAIGFSSVIALGAGADVGFAELLDFASNDADTDAVLLYVESVRPEPPFTAARLFMSALRALARAKPVIVLKAGRHRDRADHGPRADEVFEAVFRRAGTMRVHTYTQLFAAARILAMGRLPRGNRIAIVSNGRGPGLLAADRAVDTNVALARFSEETCAQLRKMLPREHEITNPLDVHGEATPERFAAAVATVLHDPEVDATRVACVAACCASNRHCERRGRGCEKRRQAGARRMARCPRSARSAQGARSRERRGLLQPGECHRGVLAFGRIRAQSRVAARSSATRTGICDTGLRQNRARREAGAAIGPDDIGSACRPITAFGFRHRYRASQGAQRATPRRFAQCR